ncbi:MAG: hypothetical protein WBW33_06335, partial [Bryobacteraceae bacterium]
VRQQAFSVLAAHAEHALGRQKTNNATPLERITPSVLVELGVSESEQQNVVARHYVRWTGTLTRFGEYSSALRLWNEMRPSLSGKCLEARVVADAWLAVAPLYWREGRFFQSLAAAGRAIAARPVVAARPVKRLFRAKAAL